MATFFSAIVLVQSVVRGSTWFESYHQSAWAVIVGYYVAALVAGVALALLRPLGNTRLGAYVLGTVIGFLVYSSVGVLAEGLSREVFVIGAIAGLAVGGLGVVAYDQGAPSWQGSGSLPKGKIIAYGAALLIALFLLWLDLR